MMKNLNFKISGIIAILLLSCGLKAQEVLGDLSVNPAIKHAILHKSVKGPSDTLNLPFIDDFAYDQSYPNENFWMDHTAFVNHTYPVNSISIGVATLDAIDGRGQLYSNAETKPFIADSLTSRPIFLGDENLNNIYLSFYYQPAGLGDSPEPLDSLLVQYYQPQSETWESIWAANYNETDSTLTETFLLEGEEKTLEGDTLQRLSEKFHPVILPINQSRHLKDGFKFRFINYASLSSNDALPSIAGNVDHWNLDYVRLDTGRTSTDTTLNDIAFTHPLGSLLKNYMALPWSHFQASSATEMEDTILITYRNIGNTTWNITREFEIKDLSGDAPLEIFTGGTGEDIPPYAYESYVRGIRYIFPYNPARDSAEFMITSYMETDTISSRAPYRYNDTIRYLQKFYNYYAYDDGSPENGYGLFGEGTSNGRVAMKFTSYKEDTLRGIQMYFNQTLDEANQKYFSLHVWNVNREDGKPGNLVYSKSGIRPEYSDSLNQFINYSLDTSIVLDGDFFIGWSKTTTDMLNVGFDLNTDNSDKLYYNISGAWKKSKFRGTVLIRPLFGKAFSTATGDDKDIWEQPLPEVKIYPNPASSYIHVELQNSFNNIEIIRLFDNFGRQIRQFQHPGSSIPVGDLSAGIYILSIQTNKGAVVNKKIIISH